MRFLKKRNIGSATLVVIISSLVFMLYAGSTYSDIRHMKSKYDNYEKNIIELFDEDYNKKIEEL